MPNISGPGADDIFDPWDLDDVRARVVLPVVRSILRPDEFRGVDIGWGPRTSLRQHGRRSGSHEFWVAVEAVGADCECPIWDPDWEGLDTLGEVAYLLGDRLEDWACEDVAWGERRIAEAVIPARVADA